MTKFAALLRAGAGLLAATVLTSAAQAAVFTIDDFTTVQGPIVDVAGGGATVSALGNRTISVDASGSNALGQNASATVNGAFFDVANSSLVSSVIELTYNLAPIAGFDTFTAGTLSFVFDSNNPANQVPTTLSAQITIGSFGPFNIPAIPPGTPTLDIVLNQAELAALTAGGDFKVTFTGGNGYDFGLDSITVSAPEPGSVLLLGAGLLGLGLASRRKRA
ncbi:PEP-CTERM sorting domain-containing protein [Hankyongella ginsenosidimutans]|uniref:PEP-CTERM sorting domain-containing protein n=1 Tax=Hankyongella ginsenosidimutans TaxID=1763828 RepID=A0A4D7C001_9SPHN|nr:PEP-CTERM sorting domain-containing protein [Hankyongella ginsenosidimutans]QCI79024.1 PEP-CTERM sorting domain-containing protein [Hankyongella ginsenosidimutans]